MNKGLYFRQFSMQCHFVGGKAARQNLETFLSLQAVIFVLASVSSFQQVNHC